MRLMPALLAMCVSVAAPAFADKHEQTVLEYGAQCAREIGEIPPFDCNSGSEIPITVNGKPLGPYDFTKQCDRPSLLFPDEDLDQQCLPHSRILNLSRGLTQISAYCRQNKPRAQPTTTYDQVVIVLHHAGNGKTCWFESRDKEKGFDASRVPPPNEKTPPGGHVPAVEFWKSPGQLAAVKRTCVSCHDASPYVQSPYIAQVWDKVPTDPWGRYSNIGPAFESHHFTAISTPGNTCVGCHRIGSDQSCQLFIGFSAGKAALSSPHVLPRGNNELANSYPLSHWMPMPTDSNMSEEQWNAANMKSVDALLSCCKNPRGPNCTLTPIATSDKAK